MSDPVEHHHDAASELVGPPEEAVEQHHPQPEEMAAMLEPPPQDEHHPQVNVTDAEAAAAAAVAASYQTQLASQAAAAAAAPQDSSNNNPGNNMLNPSNKWAKNGFGASVSKQTGKFSKDESEEVKEAIEQYCNAKQISVARLCSECDHKAELKGAWMEIAKRLPHRSVQSVYRHGIRQCHPFKRGAWSDAECTMLTELVQTLGKKWAAIQAKLNRSADSCRDKYREMSDEYVKGRWKEEETEALQKLIRDHLNHATNGATKYMGDMKELGKYVESENIQIPWSTISKRMGKRSRLSCFKKWQKMTGIVSAAEEAAAAAGGGGKHELAVGLPTALDEHHHHPPDSKRAKLEQQPQPHPQPPHHHEDSTSHAVAELAAETVEALELPEVSATTQQV